MKLARLNEYLLYERQRNVYETADAVLRIIEKERFFFRIKTKYIFPLKNTRFESGSSVCRLLAKQKYFENRWKKRKYRQRQTRLDTRYNRSACASPR